MNDIEAMANATGEVAKTAGKMVDAIERSKAFFAKVIGQPVESLSGILTDKLKVARYKRFLDLMDEVNSIHRERGISATVALDPHLGLEIISEATLTDESTLKQKWAHLLANAMDPSKAKSITRDYVETLKALTPIDAHVLQVVFDLERETEVAIGHRGFAQNLDTVVEALINKHSLTEDVALTSLEHIATLGLVAIKGNNGTSSNSLARVTRQEGAMGAEHPGQFTIDMTRVGLGFICAVS
ncbi:MAG: Abi-alpha family protein [Aestuariivirga sp.]